MIVHSEGGHGECLVDVLVCHSVSELVERNCSQMDRSVVSKKLQDSEKAGCF